ncbi:MAG: serine/threonine-protein kinase, partial [Defluviitaleaceae bacterium]|nr:serine/threonine-protein kinase [Defluviitaleaceae bacterium]
MPDIRDYEPLFGGWKIEEFLGKGTYGETYKISKQNKNMGMTQYSAVKQISISNADLRRNSELLNKVGSGVKAMQEMDESPHIVRIQDFETYNWIYGGGQDILIRMELLTSLKSILESIIDDGAKTMPIEEVRKLGIHICRMLEVCDKNNIIHRDIKPANIFRSEMGNYKLGDFGMARIMVEGQALTITGTLEYMAPEIYNNFGRYDKRVDIYSLGITLYYLLNGNKFPFEGEEHEESPITRRIDGKEKLPMLDGEGISQEFAEAILKACAHNADDRFESATLMREALEKEGESSGNVSQYYPSGRTHNLEESRKRIEQYQKYQ